MAVGAGGVSLKSTGQATRKDGGKLDGISISAHRWNLFSQRCLSSAFEALQLTAAGH